MSMMLEIRDVNVLESLVDDIVNTILNEVVINNNDNDSINEEGNALSESNYIVEEADDNDSNYIVDECDDDDNDSTKDMNTSSSSCVVVNLDRYAKLSKGCKVQPKSSSLYSKYGVGLIASEVKINNNKDHSYLVNFINEYSDIYWCTNDLYLIIHDLVITECSITDNGKKMVGLWEENHNINNGYNNNNSNSNTIDTNHSNNSSPDKKDNKQNSPSKIKNDRLYRDADRLRNKKYLAEKKMVEDFSKLATFTPKIPEVSEQLALQRLDYCNISDRLYSDTIRVKTFVLNEKKAQEEKKMATFSPNILPRSKELIKQKNANKEVVYDRLHKEASKKQEELEKKKEQKLKDDMKDVTFSPVISALAVNTSPKEQESEELSARLYSYAAKHKAKRASLRETIIKDELKEATFSPSIKVLENSTTYADRKDIVTRMHEDSHRRRASLAQKRESIIGDQQKEETFKPVISEVSHNLAAMRSASPPVTERLYEDAIKKQSRRLLEELEEEERKNQSFTPKRFTADNNVKSRWASSITSKPNSPNSSPNTKSPPKIINSNKSIAMTDFIPVDATELDESK